MKTQRYLGVQAILFGILILLLSSGASAQDLGAAEFERFEPGHWSTGLHLIAGLGANVSRYKSETANDVYGVGMNLHSDVGYFFANDYALELSTSVMFNRVRGLLIWDTVGLLGFRFRIEGLTQDPNTAYYGRLLAGPSLSVILGDVPPEQDLGGDRTHIQGQAIAFGVGSFQKASNGNVWFMEVLGIIHDYRKVEAVKVVDEVPVVVNSRSIEDNSRLYAITLTFGIVAF